MKKYQMLVYNESFNNIDELQRFLNVQEENGLEFLSMSRMCDYVHKYTLVFRKNLVQEVKL